MKKKRWFVILIIVTLIISLFIGCYYALGPRFCTDGVTNEICLYYKFDVYYSMSFVDKSDSLENHGIVLNKKILDCRTERYYLASDKYGDEVIVVEYSEYSVVYKDV